MLISLNVCTGPWEAGAQLQEQNTENNITKPHKNNPHTFTVRTKFLQNKAFSLFPLHHLCFISVLTVPPATLCLLHNLTNCTPERVTLYISSSTFRLLSKSPNAEEKKHYKCCDTGPGFAASRLTPTTLSGWVMHWLCSLSQLISREETKKKNTWTPASWADVAH